MNALRAVVLLAVISGGCTETTGDHAPAIMVNGNHYSSSAPVGLTIKQSDLLPYGSATSIVDPELVVGSDVFALRGVDPTKVVVMRSTVGGSPITLFIRVGVDAGDNGPGNSGLFAAVPGLCHYFAPSAGGC